MPSSPNPPTISGDHLAGPTPLLGYSAFLSATISPSTAPLLTALSASPLALAFAHGHGLISAFTSSLALAATVRSHLDHISALRLLSLSPHLAAVASSDRPALHLYHLLSPSPHLGSVRWFDPSDPRLDKSVVTAIADCPQDRIFAAFEAPHRENCILEIDPGTLQVQAQLGRQSGSALKTSAATKLVNLEERGLLFALAVSGGAFGCSGYMRLWDPRSGVMVWETMEPGGMMDRGDRFGDSFADADVEREEGAIYKVCSRSGDVGMADLRMLGQKNWAYLEGRSGSGGSNGVVHCFNKQVFVGKESGLEVWSRLVMVGEEGDGGYASVVGAPYRRRRDFVDKEEDAKRGAISMMDTGGDRLFVCRDGVEGVEVWESSELSRAISLL